MKPILFLSPLVNKILEGKKTQTRRAGECRFKEGDVLWVREKFAVINIFDFGNILEVCYGEGDIEKCKVERSLKVNLGKWMPSIHMPKEFSRVKLVVKKIRKEKIYDITYDDILAEGFSSSTDFFITWDRLNPTARCDSGVEVNVIEFEKLKILHT